MIPLIPAYAVSIHKSQGMSLDQITINLGEKEFASGLTYTAISRCKKFQNLAFEPFPNYIRIARVFQANAFKERLKEDSRQKELEKKTLSNARL